MVQPSGESFWQAEARTQQTKEFVRDIKRMITHHKFSRRKGPHCPGRLSPRHTDLGPLPPYGAQQGLQLVRGQ